MTVKPRKPTRCPICKEATVHDWRPFCSKRCADIDLGKWASGAYAIPTDQRPDTPDKTDECPVGYLLR